jgi:hypothetical protein
VPAARALREVGGLRQERRIAGRSMKPSVPAACLAATPAWASRKRPRIASHSASVTAPGRNMFV